jgi:hypothetical protein
MLIESRIVRCRRDQPVDQSVKDPLQASQARPRPDGQTQGVASRAAQVLTTHGGQPVTEATNGASGSDKLDTDAATFNSDASAYLSDNSPYLAPGWETGFDQVIDDINALARDCGQPTAPPNTPSSP